MKDERTPEQRVRDRIRKGLLIHRDDAQALLDELDRYRTSVTTGGPGVPFTEHWENGPSSRPSTAPPEAVAVALPEGFGEWCSEHGEEMQDHEHAVDHVDEALVASELGGRA